MSYAPKRKSISKKIRALIFERDKGICWLCKTKIKDNQPWDADHMVSRELGGADAIENLAPAHRDPCHRNKSKQDVAMIAKSNRIRRANGPVELRKKRKAIPKRKNPWGDKGQSTWKRK